MSLLSRLFGRQGSRADNRPAAFDALVDEPQRSETRLGAAPQVMPWSAARLANIIQNHATRPTPTSLQEARLARQCLSQFWLVAPVDQLELLYRSAIGECYRLLLASNLARDAIGQEELNWRTILSERLLRSFDRPETTNVLLAAMPYFAPGKMRVANPLQQVPRWLLEDYARLFEPALLQQLWQPAGLLGPAGQQYGAAPSLGVQAGMGGAMAADPGAVASGASAPAATPRPPRRIQLPQLARLRGNEALALVQSDDFLSRMSGLLNLHVIDPADAEVRQQLAELRRLLGQIWLDTPLEQMEALYRSSFGELYRNVLASGFPRAPISPEDQALRSQLAQSVADMSQPGAINALLAVLPFYSPGAVSFDGGEQHMPLWLVREIANFYGADAEAPGQPGQPAGPSGETPST
jgi:hypothetical protein